MRSLKLDLEDAFRIIDCKDSGSFENLIFSSALSVFLDSQSSSRWSVRVLIDPERPLRVASDWAAKEPGFGEIRDEPRINFSWSSSLNFLV